MKKIYFSALALIFGAGINAQILNPSFEGWTTGQPDSWTTLNGVTTIGDVTDGTDPVMPAVQGTTNAPDGASFITLTSFNLANSTNTQVANGDYGSTATQDVVTTDKYATFEMSVSYDIKPNDTAAIAINAFDANDVFIGGGNEFFAGSQATFSAVTINMAITGTVAKYKIYLTSSEGQIFNGVTSTIAPGSWLSVDNITTTLAAPDVPNVSNVVATDIADNGNGSDLKVTFDVPADESNILNYFVTVFASPYSGANLVSLEPFLTNGIEITPNGSAQSHTFSATDVYWDVVGGYFEDEIIVEDVELIITVYVKAKTGFGSVLKNSNKVTLTSSGGNVSVVEQTKSVNVYPNPATNFVNFEIDGLENGTVTINSITGQEVVNTSFANGTKIDVSHLNNGVYIYNVRNANNEMVKTNKLIIRK